MASIPINATAQFSERLRAVLNSRWPWVALLGLGFLVRLRQYLGCPSFWYDEAYLLVNIYNCSYDELIGPLRAQVVIPPLFLWILRCLYDLMGGSELTMRLPAVLSGAAALLVLLPLARRIVGRPACWWVVGLGAVSHHGLMHSYEVRPYMTDFLFAIVLLLAATTILQDPQEPSRRRWWCWIGLFLAAAFAPWLSFASAFVLIGISLTLLVESLRGRRGLWRPWLLLNAVSLASACLLWLLSARHLYYPGLREHWGERFPNLADPSAALRWLLDALVEIGHYGTTGLGVPVLLLACVGVVSLGRRSGTLALLLVAPIVAGVAAACLRRYPFGDRLLFFTVPGMWLLAVEGVLVLSRLPWGRQAWIAPVLILTLVVPGLARTVKHLVVLAPRVECREAFAYLRAQCAPEDAYWIIWPEVYEIYHPDDRSWLGCYDAPADVMRAARGRRLWVVTPHGEFFRQNFPELAHLLKEEGRVASVCLRLGQLEVQVYDLPPATLDAVPTMKGS